MAQGLELNDKIVFLGELSSESLLAYYQAADVFVQPALDNDTNNGIAVRRALAASLPVITTPVKATEELVIDQENGLLVRPSSADDLAEKIERLLLDEKLRIAMSKNSLELARKQSWETIAGQYLEVYVKTKNLGHINQE